MKKTFISLSVAALFGSSMAQAQAYTPTVTTTGNNFTMVSASNGLTGGTNDVTFTWDGTYRNAVATDGLYNATLSSPTAFSGGKWTAHHVNVYGPGTYTFNTGCASGGVASTTYNPSCGSGASYTMTVGAGQVGAHMLFNWKTNPDIDVVVLWKMNDSWAGTGTVSAFQAGGANTVNTVWNGVSIDTAMDPDDYTGTKMIDGPFVGQSANFNVNGIAAAEPVVSSNNPIGTPGTGSVVEVVFNKAMNPATLTLGSGNFTVVPTAGGGTVCGGAIVASAGDTTFTCTPTALAPNTQYTATVTTAATSAIGFPLASPYTWNFTTTVTANTLTLAAVDPTFGTATVTISGGGNLAAVNLVSSNTINAIAPSVSFDSGLLNYRITGTGAQVTVTINFPASIVGKTLYKIDSTAATPVYTAIPEGDFSRDANGTTITMNVTDCIGTPCAGYDVNPVAGTIEDPIGAGTPVVIAAAPTLGAAGGGGGCTVDPSGKDASLLAALLASLGYVGWRRRRS